MGQSLPCPGAQAQEMHSVQSSVDITESLQSMKYFVEKSEEEEGKLPFL